MRLHRLEITAFGPFADTVEVDFDVLSDAGLFLLTGATGAGKSSVLDAVCFGLYGDVPGDRSAAKRLRSDHAPATVPPRVSLECTLAGRRFRLVRSPAWERPKKRGTGTTLQQASVTMTERVGGEWQHLSSRMDETGHLVSRLLGMNLTQFTQVALLPQGRFQAFLRARSDERHRLLQQLFRTGRFEDVEAWLRERRSRLAAETREHQREVTELASRLSEVAGAELPTGVPATEPLDGAGAAVLADWASRCRAAADRSSESAARALDVATSEAAAARDRLEAARLIAERRQRRQRAVEEVAALVLREPEIEATRARLERARRAAGLSGLREALEEHRADRSAAAAGELAAAAAVADLAGDDDGPVPALSELAEHSAREAASLAVLLPEQQRLEALRADVDARRTRLEELERESSRLATAAAEHPALLAALTEQLDQARAASMALPGARSAVEAAGARLEAARTEARLVLDLAEAHGHRQAAVDAAQQHRDAWLSLQELRITGMAAELAGRLAVGACCPVCGSADHPDPAEPSAGAPDDKAQRRARRRLDDAEAERHLREEAARDLETRLALAHQASDGLSVDLAEAELAAATADVTRLARAADPLGPLAGRLEQARAQAEQQSRRRERLGAEIGESRALLARVVADAESLAGRLAAALPAGADDSLADRHSRLVSLAAAAREALEAVRSRTAADAAVARAEARLAQAARRAGFGDAAEALAAALDDEAQAELDSRVRDHEARRLACEQLLADPELAEAAALPAPDLAAATAAFDRSAAEHRSAEASARAAGAAAERLRSLHERVVAELDAAAPVRDELDLVTRVSTFVDGRSPDNRWQMRLSAYVVAARLGQVVAAANERLTAMSDRRYSLEHTARRGAGETRGGLSLTVRDDWTGESRDPATLSGGETFVVSLALALGLADVVTQEAGGADLDTLFVDEGFGALDADTLDDVLDTLDTLRDGGRVVGLVSHVPQMRDRIPTRLDVRKGRAGSTVALVRA